MNRIRKHGDKYEVLITPFHVYDSAQEISYGGFKDENLAGYSIRTYNTLQEAQDIAFGLPDIFWHKMVSDHVDNYKILQKKIKDILNDYMIVSDFSGHLMTPEELKNSMFNRVKRNDVAFRLYNNLNDIISFKIVNPRTNN